MAFNILREWWQATLAVLLTASIVVLFILLIPALGKLSDQAIAGQQAKQRQCSITPVSAKVYDDARVRGVITRRDLALFYSSRPKNCPAPPTRP